FPSRFASRAFLSPSHILCFPYGFPYVSPTFPLPTRDLSLLHVYVEPFPVPSFTCECQFYAQYFCRHGLCHFPKWKQSVGNDSLTNLHNSKACCSRRWCQRA